MENKDIVDCAILNHVVWFVCALFFLLYLEIEIEIGHP